MSHLIGSMYPGHSEKPSLVGMLRSLHPARWTGYLDWSFVISSGKTSAFAFFHTKSDGCRTITSCWPCAISAWWNISPNQCKMPSFQGDRVPRTDSIGGAMIFDSHLGGKKSWYLPSDATGWIMVIKVDSSWWFTFSKRTLIKKGLLVGGIVE